MEGRSFSLLTTVGYFVSPRRHSLCGCSSRGRILMYLHRNISFQPIDSGGVGIHRFFVTVTLSLCHLVTL